MDQLKSILKAAFARNAMCVKLRLGEMPQVVTIRGIESLEAEPQIEQVLLRSLFKVLFPKEQDRIAQGLPTRGLLTVVDRGKLSLIAQPGLVPCLKLYIPPLATSSSSSTGRKSQPSR